MVKCRLTIIRSRISFPAIYVIVCLSRGLRTQLYVVLNGSRKVLLLRTITACYGVCNKLLVSSVVLLVVRCTVVVLVQVVDGMYYFHAGLELQLLEYKYSTRGSSVSELRASGKPNCYS